MKKIAFSIIFLLFTLQFFAQEISIRVNSFYTFNRFEEIPIDTLIPKPDIKEKDKGINFDLTATKNIRGGLYLLGRIGLNNFHSDDKETNTESYGYNKQNRSRNVSKITGSVGLGKSVFSTNKFNIDVGLEIPFLIQYKNHFIFIEKRYSSSNEYLGEYDIKIDFTKSKEIGVGTFLKFDYFFYKSFAASFSANFNFIYQRKKGTTLEKQEFLDSNGNSVAKIEVPHAEKVNDFGLQNFLSIGLIYKITKKREKT